MNPIALKLQLTPVNGSALPAAFIETPVYFDRVNGSAPQSASPVSNLSRIQLFIVPEISSSPARNYNEKLRHPLKYRDSLRLHGSKIGSEDRDERETRTRLALAPKFDKLVVRLVKHLLEILRGLCAD